MVLPLPQIQTPQPAAMAPMGSPLAMISGTPDTMPVGMGSLGMQDPMSMLTDPMVMLALLDLIARDDELQNGPVYPKWYKPGDYPKPETGQVAMKARRDQEIYRKLIERIRSDLKTLSLAVVGQFPDADDDAEVTFQDPSLVHDVALVVNLVAGCDVNYEARASKLEDAELVEKKEQAAHAFREKNIRRHARMYGTSLQYDEVKTAVSTGHICGRFSLDFDAESDEIPVNMDLLDPVTCYPTWDGDRGMRSMSRIYSQTVEQVIATFETDDKQVGKDLLNTQVPDTKNGGMRNRTLADQVEVIEYWDRRWYSVTAAGKPIVTAEHKFGRVPFVYLRSSLGYSGPTSLHALSSWASGPSSTVQDEIAGKGLSHIWATKKAHEQREAILGRMFTELKKTGNPPRTIEQDLSIYGETPALTDAEGGVSLLRKGLENEVAPPQKPGFSLVGPIMGAANEAAARGLMPASAYGLTQNANESGTAIEGLNESGRDKISVWLTLMQDWDRECAEMALSLMRDWGHLLGSDGRRGEFEIERANPGADKDETITLTPAELRKTGVKLRSKRTSLRLSNLGNLGQALSVWKAQGWIEDTEALEMRGVQDPVAALRRIEIQEFKKSDEYRKAMLVSWMREEGLYREAAMVEQMITQQQQAGPPPGPPGMGQGGPPMDPTQPGGPGTMGGATPGSNTGPQMATPTQGAMGMPSRMAGPPPTPGDIGPHPNLP